VAFLLQIQHIPRKSYGYFWDSILVYLRSTAMTIGATGLEPAT